MASVYLIEECGKDDVWRAVGACDSVEAGVAYLQGLALAQEAASGPTAVFWQRLSEDGTQLRGDFTWPHVSANAGPVFSRFWGFRQVDVQSLPTPRVPPA